MFTSLSVVGSGMLDDHVASQISRVLGGSSRSGGGGLSLEINSPLERKHTVLFDLGWLLYAPSGFDNIV